MTSLPAAQEQAFQKWVQQNNVPFDPSPTADYDMRGFWKGLTSGDPHAKTATNANDGKLHFTDFWKTPYHESFSAESQWATDGAPKWNEKDQLVAPDGKVVFDERAKAKSMAKMATYEIAAPDGSVYEIEGPEGADPSQIIAQLGGASVGPQEAPDAPRKAVTSPVEHAKSAARIAAEHPFTAGVGALENQLSGITGGVGMLADAVTMSDPGTHDWAYRPRTAAGQKIAEATSDEGAAIGRAFDKVAGTGPLAQTVKERVPQALGAVGTVTAAAALRGAIPARPRATPVTAEQAVSQMDTQQAPAAAGLVNASPEINQPSSAPLGRTPGRPDPRGTPADLRASLQTAEGVLARQAQSSAQNMGAASAAPSLTNVSPELKQAIVATARKTGGAINPEVLARHVEADTLPVRVRLTEGQATQDPVIISQEMNLRGQKNSVFAEHFNEQSRQLSENVRAIREEVGPDVFSTNAAEHGDTLMGAYRAKNDVAQSTISEAYKALRDGNGGNFPVDAAALLKGASGQLHKQLLFDHAPKEIMATIGRLAKTGTMTFENFESLRTNLARIQRSPTADGNVKAAAGVIREAMEQLPLAQGAAALKPLADKARALAKQQFEALEADPAYKAAVDESVTPERFVSRYVLGGGRDQVGIMRQNLTGDDAALQTMAVVALDHLRSAARLDPGYQGNFAAASYNKALTTMAPNLRTLFPARAAEQLEQLGNVARYTTAQPRGSFVNNSNTFVAGAADYGAGALEGVANVAAGGVPVGTWTRTAISEARGKRAARRSTAPGAGLDRLPERRQ